MGLKTAIEAGVSALIAVSTTFVVHACAADSDADERPSEPTPDGPLARREGPYAEWSFCEGECSDRLKGDIALREVACSAKIDCHPALLFDEQLNRRPSLVTGLSCEFPATQPADALLGFHPLVTCYDFGDPGDPATWSGAHVVASDGDSHLFFAAADNRGTTANLGTGISWLDAGQRLGALAGYAVCHVRALGFVGFSAFDGEPRRVMHDRFAPVVEFSAVIEPGDGVNDYACHDEPAGLSWVAPRVVRSVTHDRPDHVDKGDFPTTHDIVMIDDADGLVAISVVGSTFPPSPNAAPVPFVVRDLDPSDTLEAAWTCPEVVAGQLAAVAIQLAGGGVIVVRREVEDAQGMRSWDCERDATAACVVFADEDIGVEAPCLLPVILTP